MRRIGWSLAALAAIFAVSLIVLDAGYLFQGCGRPVAAFHFHSRLLRALARPLPSRLPLPLPAPYLAGFDVIQLINETGEFPSYLLGRWWPHGSIAYYPIALLVKTPLPLLAAWLAAVLAGRRRKAPGQRGAPEYLVWLPIAVLLAVFILLSRVEYGIRYVLPAVPLALIYTGRLVPWARRRGKPVRIAAVALLLCYPLSVLLATPDTIAYFNLLAGGRGDRILLETNLDWGQGLKRLRAYMDRAGIERIPLAYFGHVDPAIYGIRWRLPDPNQHGPVAISANFLHGYPYATYAAGRILPVPADAFTWVARYPRSADLGGGIYVYDVR